MCSVYILFIGKEKKVYELRMLFCVCVCVCVCWLVDEFLWHRHKRKDLQAIQTTYFQRDS